MKKICIIGAGLGAASLTRAAEDAIGQSGAVFGAGRLLSEYSGYTKGKRCEAKYAAEDIISDISDADENCFSVLVSGDPGFYSASLNICRAFEEEEAKAPGRYEVTVYPGISSLNAMFSALKLPWQDAALCSLHGRDANAADTVRRNRYTFFLTGKNTGVLSEKLCSAGYGDIKLYVGEDLGSTCENVFSCTAAELAEKELSSLTVVVAENPDADASVPAGLADESFVRGDVPMTKSEIRAVIMSRLRIKPEMTCADIGAGTGSCTVEMALAAWKGKVYAIDPDPEAVDLIRKNCRNFHIGNVTAEEGLAPEGIRDWPAMDAVFIGGSKGNMEEIFGAILAKNPKARIVTSAIVLQTLQSAMQAFKKHGIDPEIVQIGAAASRKVGGMDMMMARNPIFIVSGGGER